MNIKISTDGNQVTLWHGEQMDWDAWLRMTERAVKAIRAALNARTYDNVTTTMYHAAVDARTWLNACGIDDRADFEALEKRLPLLSRPATQSNATRCRRCGTRIWGREALATGLGSECRRGAASHAVRTLRTIRQGV